VVTCTSAKCCAEERPDAILCLAVLLRTDELACSPAAATVQQSPAAIVQTIKSAALCGGWLTRAASVMVWFGWPQVAGCAACVDVLLLLMPCLELLNIWCLGVHCAARVVALLQCAMCCCCRRNDVLLLKHLVFGAASHDLGLHQRKRIIW
jgi:hypothetical protein